MPAGTAWKPGLRVKAYGNDDTGVVTWVGRSKRGGLRVGVRRDSDGVVVFFTPGVSLWRGWVVVR